MAHRNPFVTAQPLLKELKDANVIHADVASVEIHMRGDGVIELRTTQFLRANALYTIGNRMTKTGLKESE